MKSSPRSGPPAALAEEHRTEASRALITIAAMSSGRFAGHQAGCGYEEDRVRGSRVTVSASRADSLPASVLRDPRRDRRHALIRVRAARGSLESGHEVTMVTAAAGAGEEAQHRRRDRRDGGERRASPDYVRATASGLRPSDRRLRAPSPPPPRQRPCAHPAPTWCSRPRRRWRSPSLESPRPAATGAAGVRGPRPVAGGPDPDGRARNPLARTRRGRWSGARTGRRRWGAVAGHRDGVVAAGGPRPRLLIPNAADLDLFSPKRTPATCRPLRRRFVPAYFGTMGEANDLDQVVAPRPCCATAASPAGSSSRSRATASAGRRSRHRSAAGAWTTSSFSPQATSAPPRASPPRPTPA